MTLHAFLQYLSYRRKAMGRHGLHSPFVYALVEDGIQKNKDKPLEQRLSAFLKDWPQVIFTQEMPQGWIAAFQALQLREDARQMVWVKGIHTTAAHTRNWEQLCGESAVTYSLDLYDDGLLFLNPDFKVKQHFILRNK